MQFSALFAALLATGVAASPVAIDLINRGYSTTPVYPTTTTTTPAYPTTTTTTVGYPTTTTTTKSTTTTTTKPTTTTTTTVYPTTTTTTKPTTTTTTTKSTTTVGYPTTTTTTSVVYPTSTTTTTVGYPTTTTTTAYPTTTGGGGGGGYFACPSGLFSVPQCCSTDILGLADLDCHSPAAVPSSPSSFQSICAAGGQRARCCVIPVLGQAVLCETPAGL